MKMAELSETVLAALKDFKTDFDLARTSYNSTIAKKGEVSEIKMKTPVISPQLDQYLKEISKSGQTKHPWKLVKPLVMVKLDAVMKAYNEKDSFDKVETHPNCKQETFQSLYTTIMQATDSFAQAPFTVQRLCELICFPYKHYKRIDKYMRALEKIVLVVTTVDEYGRKLTSESSDENAPATGKPSASTNNLIPLFEWINKSIPQDITERLEFKPESIMRQRQSSGEWIPSFPPSRLDEGDDDAINDSPVINPSPVHTHDSSAIAAAEIKLCNPKSQKRALNSEPEDEQKEDQRYKKVKTDSIEPADSDSVCVDSENLTSKSENSSTSESSEKEAVVTEAGGETSEQPASGSNSSDTLTDDLNQELPLDPEQTTAEQKKPSSLGAEHAQVKTTLDSVDITQVEQIDESASSDQVGSTEGNNGSI